MKLATLIAWRYLTHKQKDSNIAFMTKICCAGIIIGTFSLMLTLIITNGFEKVIHEKIQGISAQIIISSPGNALDYDALRPVIQTSMSTTIAGVTGSSIKQAILDQEGGQSVLFVKGVDPEHEAMVTTLVDKIVQPKTPVLSQLLQPDCIIIGHKTAQEHNLVIGQKIKLLIPEPSGKRTLTLKKQMVTVAGIFNIGLDEYDHNLIFMSLDTMHDMYDTRGVDQLALKLTPYKPSGILERLMRWWHGGDYHEQIIIKELRAKLPGFSVHSWKDLNPSLVASLKLEKYVMFFVLALITLVASMNMVALLFMQMQSKQADMAILRAMGAAPQQLRKIFLTMGMTITLIASSVGLLLALAAGYALERYPFIQLPDVYYVSHVPARIDLEIFLAVFLVTLLLGFCATWLPAQRAARINIINVLRQS